MSSLPSFFVEELNRQYGENELRQIIDGLVKKKTSFRINNLKARREEIEELLDKKGIRFRKPKWYENAYTLDSTSEDLIEKEEIYIDGKIYVQNLSSMIPPIVLAPQENEDILDMCAAPGGKTTELACLSNNMAHITACEMNQIRMQKLEYNIKKQGATSVYVMPKDSRNLDDFLKFDKILLDSPCSGSGTLDISNEKNDKYFTEYLIQKSVKAQKALLNKAINLLKKDGILVYSTCSILKQENEEVIKNISNRKDIKLVPIDKSIFQEIPMLSVTINGTICVKPTDVYEGFFVAKLKKI